MYIIVDEKRYYLSRAYWFESGMCTVYEFVSVDGDIYTEDVLVNECLEYKVELMEG